VFEKHRERKAREAAEKARAAELAAASTWQAQRDGYAHFLELIRGFHGEQTSEIVLKAGEALFGKVDGASLIEDRAGRGSWQGRSQGVSIPVASLGGHAIRYHVGASKGHYVAGTPVPTAIDTGTVFITNHRVVFRGQKQTRECMFDKLVSCHHEAGESIFSVSNRQKNTVIYYGPQIDDWFQTRYAVAFADFQGTREQLSKEVEDEISSLDASRPQLAAPPSSGNGGVA
jgi:hypothetical protein